MIMHGVREYAEGMAVEIHNLNGRTCIRATNEGGHNCVDIDLADVLRWVFVNQPSLWYELPSATV